MTDPDTRTAPGTALVVQQPAGGALELRPQQTQWTPDQLAALNQLGLAEATEADMKVLMHQSQRTGLDPFSRQVHMIYRKDSQAPGGGKWTIQTGIDGFRIIADRRPEYRGQVGPEWCGEDGVWRDVWLANQPPVAARVGVIRSDFDKPVYGVAIFREYAQHKYGGGLTSMWSTKSAHMIAKCAEALAIRKAFPNDLSGLITDDEAARDDLPRAEAPARSVDARAALTAAELTGAPPADPPPHVAPAPAAPAEPSVMQQIVTAGKERGWSAEELTLDFKARADGTDPRKARPEELQAYLDWLLKQPPRGTDTDAKPSKRMLDKLHAQLAELQVNDKDRHDTLSLLAARRISSANDLSKDDVQRLINRLDRILEDAEPLKAMDAELAAAAENTAESSGSGESA